MRRARAFLPLLALVACGPDPVGDDEPLAVSVIGAAPHLADPDRRALDAPSAALLAATAQGLVRFDAAGQIEPGLAIRWDVSDDGLYYTFRLRDGARVDAEQAARRLRAAIARGSLNPLKPILGAIAEIVAVTPEVIEIRLSAPRPDLLQLVAQPELALVARGAGGGPLRPLGRGGDALRLGPIPDPDAAPGVAGRGAGDDVLLRGERAGLAVARFKAGFAAVVTGGTFADLAIVRAAQVAPREVRVDPAVGAFGLQIVSTGAFLQGAENRRALSMAIDRDKLVAAFGVPGWRPAVTLVPAGTELARPVIPAWQVLSLTARAQAAALTVRAWQPPGAPPLKLRVALPAGPGARLLFAALAADWRAIGVAAEAVPFAAEADLRLVDAVAPGDVATWYLRRFMCVRATVCSAAADALLDAARVTRSIPERAQRLAEADAKLDEIVPFIPLAMPLRWSLVSSQLDNWRDNPRAVHPLYHLRDAG